MALPSTEDTSLNMNSAERNLNGDREGDFSERAIRFDVLDNKVYQRRPFIWCIDKLPLALLFLSLGILIGSAFTQKSPVSVLRSEETCAEHMKDSFDSSFCYPDSHDAEPLAVPVESMKVSFLVVGDWGRNGFCCQNDVAEEMSKISLKFQTNFTINAGDNFYSRGILHSTDKQVERSWRKVYDRRDLIKKPWYGVLGNHDYYGNVRAQFYISEEQGFMQWNMPGRFYVKRFGQKFLDIVFIDTTPLFKAYWGIEGFEENLETNTIQQYQAELTMNLTRALENSNSLWKIVVGHHPVFSIGDHFKEAKEDSFMRDTVHPILSKYGVHAYFNGHDHNLQHLHDTSSGVHYFVSGAGSKIRYRGAYVSENIDKTLFHYGSQGFAYSSLNQTHMRVMFFNARGVFLYQTLLRNLKSTA